MPNLPEDLPRYSEVPLMKSEMNELCRLTCALAEALADSLARDSDKKKFIEMAKNLIVTIESCVQVFSNDSYEAVMLRSAKVALRLAMLKAEQINS
jgi:hypothetical protein